MRYRIYLDENQLYRVEIRKKFLLFSFWKMAFSISGSFYRTIEEIIEAIKSGDFNVYNKQILWDSEICSNENYIKV